MDKKIDPIAVAFIVADRWIREERYKWLIYHTNISHYALIRLTEASGKKKYLDHVEEAYRFYENEIPDQFWSPDYHMHTFGIAESELLLVKKSPSLENIVMKHAEDLLTNQRRGPDGAFTHRDKNVVFVDCLAGIVPFLAKTGKYTGEDKYFDEAVKQIRIFQDRITDRETGLINQGEGYCIFPDWPEDERRQTEGAWGRGNGWMALALTELLASLPKSHSGYNEIEQRFRSYMDIILKYQDENGMWRQIIDREDAYPETSGTALILYSLAHGVRNKLLPYNLLEIIENGYAGLLDMIEEDGTIHGTCIGTPFQINEDAYFNLPAPVDDLHGHGPVILACAEIALLRGLSGNP